MKYLIFSLLATICFTDWAMAQNHNELNPCGTISGRSKWLKQYQQQPDAYEKGADSTIYVPMTIHILGRNSGSGYFKLDDFLDAFCQLNSDYAETNLHFYVEGEINYINNTDWYDHEDILTGVEMMFANNIENTLNVYFVSDPAGNCGYNLPYAGIVNKKSCSGPNDHTWAHEVGHALSLPHPFLGWEGGVSHDGSVSHSYNNPAPRVVYYDYTLFKDQLYLDTLIIDTALVELTNGSNCFDAADGFCDTEPDYLSNRWQCNDMVRSLTQQTDPDGVKFTSDGSLIMGYSLDACAARFTPEQIAAMRANLLDQKAAWLDHEAPLENLVMENIVVESPFEGEITAAEDIYFEWDSIENATHYILQISRLSSFSFNEIDVVLTENTYSVESLRANRTYYWRVRPFNRYSACADFSETFSFETSDVTATQDIAANLGIELYPNLIKEGESIHLFSSQLKNEVNLALYDGQGRKLQEEEISLNIGENVLPFSIINQGIYFLEIKNRGGVVIEKILVQ